MGADGAGLTILCAECGELIEVRDPAALIHALHLQNDCAAIALLQGRPTE